MTRDLAAFAVANAAVLLSGHGVLRFIGVRPAPGDLPWSVALAYVAGAAAVGVLGSAALVVGFSLAWWQILCGCLLLWTSGLFRRGRAWTPPRVPLTRLTRVLLGVAYVVLLILVVDFVVQPVWNDDAWAIWGAKASSIVQLDGLDPSFLQTASVVSPSYPLVVPVLEVVALRFCGLPNELVVLQLGLLFVALPGALVALLRDRAESAALGVVALGIVLAPSLQIQAASAVADVPLAVFFALAGIAAWRWIELGESSMLRLAGLLAAAALGTKVEGAAFVALLFVALGWFAVRRRRSLRPFALVVAAVVASAAPWELWSRVHSLTNPFSEAGGVGSVDLMAVVDRIPRAGGAMLRELADPTSWIALLALAAAGIAIGLLRRNARDAALYTLFITVSSLMTLLGLYWATPLDFDYHVATSVRRVITAPVVFAAAMAPLLLSRPREPQRDR